MSCHGRAPFGAKLDLTPENAYAQLVNVPAVRAPGQIRVKPGDVAASFLWRKLVNDLPTDGSEGHPMPIGGAMMWSEPPSEAMNTLKTWIQSGAKP